MGRSCEATCLKRAWNPRLRSTVYAQNDRRVVQLREYVPQQETTLTLFEQMPPRGFASHGFARQDDGRIVRAEQPSPPAPSIATGEWDNVKSSGALNLPPRLAWVQFDLEEQAREAARWGRSAGFAARSAGITQLAFADLIQLSGAAQTQYITTRGSSMEELTAAQVRQLAPDAQTAYFRARGASSADAQNLQRAIVTGATSIVTEWLQGNRETALTELRERYSTQRAQIEADRDVELERIRQRARENGSYVDPSPPPPPPPPPPVDPNGINTTAKTDKGTITLTDALMIGGGIIVLGGLAYVVITRMDGQRQLMPVQRSM